MEQSVPHRAALIVAVDSFLEAGLSRPYAAADAEELLRALPAVGYQSNRCLMLSGSHATKAIIESHLARLSKILEKPESLLVLIVSRAFTHRGKGYLACSDTIHSDRPGTAIAVEHLIASIHKARCRETCLLLDLDPFPLAGDLTSVGLNERELQALLADSPSCTALLAASPVEQSLDSAPLRRGIWRHHLLEAFSGKVREGIPEDGRLSAASLHSYLAEAVPQTVERSFETSREQTPLLLGEQNAGMIVAELRELLEAAGPELDAARMRRVVFRHEESRKIRDLAGFRKSHSLPERANEWARKFVNRVAQIDIKADVDETFERIREQFPYKRKDIEVSAGRDGVGFIRTPDFEYTISVEVNGESPSEVIWRREVGRLADAEVVRSERFGQVFGSAFDKLAFELAEPLDVAGFVDRLEANPLEGVTVRVDSTLDAAEVRLAGLAGRIHVSRDTVVIEGRSGATAGLLDHYLAFLRKFQGAAGSAPLVG